MPHSRTKATAEKLSLSEAEGLSSETCQTFAVAYSQSTRRQGHSAHRLEPSIWSTKASMSSECGAKPCDPGGVRYALHPTALRKKLSRHASTCTDRAKLALGATQDAVLQTPRALRSAPQHLNHGATHVVPPSAVDICSAPSRASHTSAAGEAAGWSSPPQSAAKPAEHQRVFVVAGKACCRMDYHVRQQ